MPVGSVSISWRNGDDEFCIAQVKTVIALEEKCGCGVYEIAGRLQSVLAHAEAGQIGGRAYLNDIREVIRLGLIGGGKEPEVANKIVATNVDGYPLAHSVLVANKIVEAYLIGVPDDPVGKTVAPEAKTDQDSSTKTVASDAQPSTASAPASAGPRARRTSKRSGK